MGIMGISTVTHTKIKCFARSSTVREILSPFSPSPSQILTYQRHAHTPRLRSYGFKSLRRTACSLDCLNTRTATSTPAATPFSDETASQTRKRYEVYIQRAFMPTPVQFIYEVNSYEARNDGLLHYFSQDYVRLLDSRSRRVSRRRSCSPVVVSAIVPPPNVRP